jgi:hypothetical protein
MGERQMTTKYNAQALMDEVRKEYPRVSGYTLAVFAAQRAIERHEAFRQEVSDAVVNAIKDINAGLSLEGSVRHLRRLIIPAPKPDPLVDALLEAFPDYNLGNNLFHLTDHAERFRKAIAKRDGKIVWEQGE